MGAAGPGPAATASTRRARWTPGSRRRILASHGHDRAPAPWPHRHPGQRAGLRGIRDRLPAGRRPARSGRLLGSALDAGLTVIDTAECYEDSEVLVGKATGPVATRSPLFTKCGHAGGWGRADWRPAALLRSIERSLGRLGTDHVDLIQLHSCSLAELRKGDVIDALERARERGLGPLHRLQWRRRGRAPCRGVRALRHAPDLGQHRGPGGPSSSRCRWPASAGWASSPSGRWRTSPGATRGSPPRRTTRRTGRACALSTTASCGTRARRGWPRPSASRSRSPASTRHRRDDPARSMASERGPLAGGAAARGRGRGDPGPLAGGRHRVVDGTGVSGLATRSGVGAPTMTTLTDRIEPAPR